MPAYAHVPMTAYYAQYYAGIICQYLFLYGHAEWNVKKKKCCYNKCMFTYAWTVLTNMKQKKKNKTR